MKYLLVLVILVLSACGRERGCWYHIDVPPDGARYSPDCRTFK